MYCVRCGVRLQDGVKACPLCQTPVIVPGEQEMPDFLPTYSDRMPEQRGIGKFFVLAIITALLAASSLSCLFLCLRIYGRTSWSGYVIIGTALTWVIFILPFWFRRFEPLVFIPIDTTAICGYLLYICLANNGHWFLSFAFPVTMIAAGMVLLAIVLFRFTKVSRLILTGIFLITSGCMLILLEFFMHITFQTRMFVWSLFGLTGFSLIGLVLLLSGIIPPLRDYLERRFFF